MSSFPPTDCNSADSDDHFPLLDIMSTFYDIERRPFALSGLEFQDLPPPTRDFLQRNAGRLPSAILEGDGAGAYFAEMLRFRWEEQEVLRWTLEDVHRAIAANMLSLSLSTSPSPSPSPAPAPAPANEEALPKLRDVLIPEWRAHLDVYVDTIDALLWFEQEARKGGPFAMRPGQVERERHGDVLRMVEFAVRCLQDVYEGVKREMEREMKREVVGAVGEKEGEEVLVQPDSEREEGQELEQMSDASSSSGTSEGHDDNDDEEDLFSESDDEEGDFMFSSGSGSESQWVDVRSSFTRVAY